MPRSNKERVQNLQARLGDTGKAKVFVKNGERWYQIRCATCWKQEPTRSFPGEHWKAVGPTPEVIGVWAEHRHFAHGDPLPDWFVQSEWREVPAIT